MAQFAIYKIKFQASDDVDTCNQDIDPQQSLNNARELFASLFTQEPELKLFDPEGGEHFNNYIWTKPDQDVYLLRLHKSQIKNLVKLQENPDGGAPECIEKQEESNPYCYLIFDNRPNRGQVAIEKSSIWQNDPDKAGIIIQEFFSRYLSTHYRIQISLFPKIQPTRIWDYYEQLIAKGDVLQSVTFELDNPDKIKDYRPAEQEQQISEVIRSMTETVKRTGSLRGIFKLVSDHSDPISFEQKVEDFDNMVRICGTQAYHLVLNFKKHKAYHCDEKVRALIKLNRAEIEAFQHGQKVIDDTTDDHQEYALVQWLDYVYTETENFETDAKIHRARKGRNKK